MARIVSLKAREILDSRGRPTVEAELVLDDGTVGSASVPSGASTGRHEAVERRDGDSARFGGLGVRGAAASIGGEIAAAVVGESAYQPAIDGLLCDLDGTDDKGRLGANAILAVSLATARAAASSAGMPLWRWIAGDRPVSLPRPMVNIISGGLHAGRQLDFQDFLIIPARARSISQALTDVVAVHVAMGELLVERGLSSLRADEGGYGPQLSSHREALELLDSAVERAGLVPGEDMFYALDIAASHFYDRSSGRYRLSSEELDLSSAELIDYIADLVSAHAVVSVEDPLAEDDWEAWSTVTQRLGDRLQVIGDDLFTTNPQRLQRGIATDAANAVLVKMNQIGTLTETINVVEIARAADYRTVISARSGETEDPFLADLAVGVDGGQIKVGSVTQSERLAKYNQLLRIEEQLNGSAMMRPWQAPGS